MPHQVKERVFLDGTAEFLLGDIAGKAVEQLRARLGIHNVPHFRLAVFALMRKRIRIVRMHLHGEIVMRVNELDEHREALEIPAAFPRCLRMRRKECRQRHPGIVPRSDHAFPIRVAG